MRFGEQVDDNCEKYQKFGESLQLVEVHKDLGVYVDVKLRFHEHVNLVLERLWLREIHGMSGIDYVDRLYCTGLFSIHGRLLRINLVLVWKSFHPDVDLDLESLF